MIERRNDAGWILGFLIAMGLTGALVGALLPGPRAAVEPCTLLPHHVPKFPGVATLRFAMVHDAVTERYPTPALAYYDERTRRTRLELAAEESRMSEGKETKKHLELIDDLAAGLDMLGKQAESIAPM